MAAAPPYLALAHLDDGPAFCGLRAYVERENPGYTIEPYRLDGEQAWAAEQAVLFAWLISGHASASVQTRGEDVSGGREEQSLQPGDVLVVDRRHTAVVRGEARFIRIHVSKRTASAWAGVRQLADLPDVAGGCNVGSNAFRRLQITWQEDGRTSNDPDGDNLLGCHVLYIAAETSRTHYHPVPSRGGGMNQHELYLVLDPADYGFARTDDRGGVLTYPEPGDWDRYDWTPLRPGDVLAIKAGVAHRAVDILACVIAIPGFKPGIAGAA
jgi:hypothetical protein